jgi:hypothetical protein
MKHLLTISTLALTMTVSAQCTLSRNEVDPFTGTKIVATKMEKTKDRSGGRDLYTQATTVTDEGGDLTALTLYLMPSPSSCVSTTSKVTFLWPDGGTETLTHYAGVKCSNPSHMVVVPDNSRILKENPSAVRLYFTEGYVDVTLAGDAVARHVLCTLLQ